MGKQVSNGADRCKRVRLYINSHRLGHLISSQACDQYNIKVQSVFYYFFFFFSSFNTIYYSTFHCTVMNKWIVVLELCQLFNIEKSRGIFMISIIYFIFMILIKYELIYWRKCHDKKNWDEFFIFYWILLQFMNNNFMLF